METKSKTENGKLVKETKPTTLKADGTSDVVEVKVDKDGTHEKKYVLDKDNRPMLKDI